MKGFEMDPAALDTSGSSPGGGEKEFSAYVILFPSMLSYMEGG
jgi:hypothetical protein